MEYIGVRGGAGVIGDLYDKKKDLLSLEDITFIAKLAEFVKPKTGRPLVPHSYNPYKVASILTRQQS